MTGLRLVDDKAGDQAGPAAEASADLLRRLKDRRYGFVAPSVETHQRILRRREGPAENLRDVFGWSRPFDLAILDPDMTVLLDRAGLLTTCGPRWRSAARVASLGGDLFLHSAFPATAKDAVFFGPDTYRFAAFLREELKDSPRAGVVVDLGAGTGAGAVVAARQRPPDQLVLIDTNPKALGFAAANLRAAGLEAELLQGDGLSALEGAADLIIANPPFIAGSGRRTYRDGGDLHGARLSLDWAAAAVEKLHPGGRLLLYTGSAIIEGVDVFRDELARRLSDKKVEVAYREIDPDIYGELLDGQAYADVERIAAVGVAVTRLE